MRSFSVADSPIILRRRYRLLKHRSIADICHCSVSLSLVSFLPLVHVKKLMLFENNIYGKNLMTYLDVVHTKSKKKQNHKSIQDIISKQTWDRLNQYVIKVFSLVRVLILWSLRFRISGQGR